MQAFERKCDDLLGRLISGAAGSSDPRHRYLSLNVEWDGRLPERRHAHFENEIGGAGPVKSANIRDALRFYKRNRVDKSNPSSFDRSWNGANEVLPSAYPFWRSQPDYLGTVVNLSWHTGMFLEARRNQDKLFSDFPAPGADPSAEKDWFDRNFTSRSDAERTDFLDQAFEAIWAYRRKRGSKPVWVAEWDRMSALFHLPTDEWLRFVGVEPTGRYPQLVVALRYGMKDGMPPLFRPTQLESGDNHRHFPLPGYTEPSIGGFALNLSDQAADPAKEYHCSREWVHSPFRWQGSYFQGANYNWGWTTGSASDPNLAVQRLRHNEYVRAKLPEVKASWMPVAI